VKILLHIGLISTQSPIIFSWWWWRKSPLLWRNLHTSKHNRSICIHGVQWNPEYIRVSF